MMYRCIHTLSVDHGLLGINPAKFSRDYYINAETREEAEQKLKDIVGNIPINSYRLVEDDD